MREKLPLEMKKLLQERGLNPNAYDLRSFEETPDLECYFFGLPQFGRL